MKNKLGLFMCSTALVGILYTSSNEVRAAQTQNKQTNLQPAKINKIARVSLSSTAINVGNDSEITVNLFDQDNKKILDINKDIQKIELKDSTGARDSGLLPDKMTIISSRYTINGNKVTDYKLSVRIKEKGKIPTGNYQLVLTFNNGQRFPLSVQLYTGVKPVAPKTPEMPKAPTPPMAEVPKVQQPKVSESEQADQADQNADLNELSDLTITDKFKQTLITDVENDGKRAIDEINKMPGAPTGLTEGDRSSFIGEINKNTTDATAKLKTATKVNEVDKITSEAKLKNVKVGAKAKVLVGASKDYNEIITDLKGSKNPDRNIAIQAKEKIDSVIDQMNKKIDGADSTDAVTKLISEATKDLGEILTDAKQKIDTPSTPKLSQDEPQGETTESIEDQRKSATSELEKKAKEVKEQVDGLTNILGSDKDAVKGTIDQVTKGSQDAITASNDSETIKKLLEDGKTGLDKLLSRAKTIDAIQKGYEDIEKAASEKKAKTNGMAGLDGTERTKLLQEIETEVEEGADKLLTAKDSADAEKIAKEVVDTISKLGSDKVIDVDSSIEDVQNDGEKQREAIRKLPKAPAGILDDERAEFIDEINKNMEGATFTLKKAKTTEEVTKIVSETKLKNAKISAKAKILAEASIIENNANKDPKHREQAKKSLETSLKEMNEKVDQAKSIENVDKIVDEAKTELNKLIPTDPKTMPEAPKDQPQVDAPTQPQAPKVEDKTKTETKKAPAKIEVDGDKYISLDKKDETQIIKLKLTDESGQALKPTDYDFKVNEKQINNLKTALPSDKAKVTVSTENNETNILVKFVIKDKTVIYPGDYTLQLADDNISRTYLVGIGIKGTLPTQSKTDDTPKVNVPKVEEPKVDVPSTPMPPKDEPKADVPNQPQAPKVEDTTKAESKKAPTKIEIDGNDKSVDLDKVGEEQVIKLKLIGESNEVLKPTDYDFEVNPKQINNLKTALPSDKVIVATNKDGKNILVKFVVKDKTGVYPGDYTLQLEDKNVSRTYTVKIGVKGTLPTQSKTENTPKVNVPKIEEPKVETPLAPMPDQPMAPKNENKQVPANIVIDGDDNSIDINKKGETQIIKLKLTDASGKTLKATDYDFKVNAKQINNLRTALPSDKVMVTTDKDDKKILVKFVVENNDGVYPGDYTLQLEDKAISRTYTVKIGIKGTLPKKDDMPKVETPKVETPKVDQPKVGLTDNLTTEKTKAIADVQASAAEEAKVIAALPKMPARITDDDEDAARNDIDMITQKAIVDIKKAKTIEVINKAVADAKLNFAKTRADAQRLAETENAIYKIKNNEKLDKSLIESAEKIAVAAGTAIDHATSIESVNKIVAETKTKLAKLIAPKADKPVQPMVPKTEDTPKVDVPKVDQPKVDKPTAPTTPAVPKTDVKPSIPSVPKQNTPTQPSGIAQPQIVPRSNSESILRGIVFAPIINNNPGWKIALWDRYGNLTGKYILTNSYWKVFAKKMINGEWYYRLGSQNQWVPAKYLTIESSSDETQEVSFKAIAYLPVINNNVKWKVALWSSTGKLTGKYISTNSYWKVFAKKMIKGQWYYRLGTMDQWVPAKYAKIV